MKYTAHGAQYDTINEGRVTEANGQSVEYTHHEDWGNMTASFSLPAVNSLAKVGDRIRVYIHGGSSISQVDLNFKPVYWITPAEEAARHEKWKEDLRIRKLALFEEARAGLDADYDALPPALQRRIDVFRRYCPEDFRVEYEGYEMVVCKDAMKLVAIPKDGPVDEWYRAFAKADYKEQQAQLAAHGVELDPGLSGNQFGMIVWLADFYEQDPGMAFQYHGAMTPLTGCLNYGCPHPRRLEPDGSYWVDDAAWVLAKKDKDR